MYSYVGKGRRMENKMNKKWKAHEFSSATQIGAAVGGKRKRKNQNHSEK